MNKGKVVQIIGPVVDVEFPEPLPAIYNALTVDFDVPGEGRVKQSTGPLITGMLDFTDGSFKSQRFVVEDDGFPNLLLNALKAYLDARVQTIYAGTTEIMKEIIGRGLGV